VTVPNVYSPPQYAGNGVTTTFGFPFNFFAPSDLGVSLLTTATGVPVAPQPVLNGAGTYDYVVTGTNDPETGEYLSGGAVVFTNAPLSGVKVTIARSVSNLQLSSLTANGPQPAKTIEGALDRLTMLSQQNKQGLARAIQAPATDAPGLNLTLPSDVIRAGLFLAFDGFGNTIAIAPPEGGGGGGGGGGTISDAMAPVCDAITLTAALAALGALAAAGGTLSGALLISGGGLSVIGGATADELTVTAASGASAILSAPAATAKLVSVQTGSSERWAFGANATAESGANAGSDFVLLAWGDAGAFLGTYLTVTRASGLVSIAGALAAASLALTAPLPVASGGTGTATLPTNSVLLGNGTAALQSVAPGASGNILTSNGSTWGSIAALPSLVVGTPTGGNLGAGKLNAQAAYVNDQAVLASPGGFTAGTYGGTSGALQITIDALGRITNVQTVPYPASGSGGIETGGGSCFVGGSYVLMADGVWQPIEQVAIGELVAGARGESNPIRALDRPLLGRRNLFALNGEHITSPDHPHVAADLSGFYTNSLTQIYAEWGSFVPVITADGPAKWRNVGLPRARLAQLAVGHELRTTAGARRVVLIEEFYARPSTQLYNFVVDGSHTYCVRSPESRFGYWVTGWPQEFDFNYDTWKPVASDYVPESAAPGTHSAPIDDKLTAKPEVVEKDRR
jgi:hypothetical protein